MDERTVFIEKKGTLTLEGGVEVRIVQGDGGGLRLFVDRPLSYCEDIIVFEGEEEEGGEEAAVAPLRRRMGPPPVKRMAMLKKRREDRYGMLDL